MRLLYAALGFGVGMALAGQSSWWKVALVAAIILFEEIYDALEASRRQN